MSKFTPTSKANPCLSCGDTKGNCRHQDIEEIILCMSANSSRKGEIVEGGYKVIDFTQDGLWAVLKLDNQQWAEEQKQHWADEQRRRREKFQWEEQQKLAKLISIPDRDEQYRRIVATLGLNQKHRISELSQRRGLNSEQIDFAVSQGWLASWKPGLKVDAPPSLAGVSGGQLTGVIGLAIAAVNLNGEITGFQIASDNRVKFGNYIWLSSANKGGNGPHLPSGELPVFLWRHPEAEQITETWLVEGGLKSLITALELWFRHGRKDIQIIGAAGANWLGSINAVVDGLGQTSKVVLCPDAGSLDNSHILSNYKKIIEELTSRTYSVSVAWWDQLEKGQHPDIDELDNILGFDLITPGEFFSLADESESFDDSQDWAWRNWLKSRRYTPDIVVNQSQFRFAQIPDKDVIISAKSGLGSGKTEALIELIRLCSNRAFMIGYRNNLLLQTGNRASQVGLKIYHLNDDDGRYFVADNATHLALCLDSIHHIDGYFKGVDIYLDETVSVLLHATNGGTLKEEQGRAIAILSKALRECNRVILLDGNLADIYVDFIVKITGKKVIKIENQAQVAPHTFKFIVGIDEDGEIKKRDKSPLIKALLSDDVRPWIASDSKNLTDRLDEILRQAGKFGYVLNKDTSGELWAKEFLVNPDAFIEKYKPDYFIISPTAESGVSVTVKNYFTEKFTFFTGVQGTNSQHQMLFRLRDNTIPHYVFCPEQSTIRDRNNPKNYSAKAFSKLLDEKIIQSAILAADGNNSKMLEIIGNAIARSNDDWWQLSSQLGALDNFEMNNLRKCLIHALEEVGHSVEICEWETDDGAKAKDEAAKEAVRMRYASELYQAIEFNSIDEASKVAKSNPTKEVQRRIEKTWLLDALPEIKESSLWDAEFIADYYLKDKEFISKQRRFYFLNNFEISKKRSEVNWYYMATNQNFFLAQAKGDSHQKIWALQELNILQFLDGEFHKNSPAVVKLINTVRERNDIALALNTVPKPETESKKENIGFLRSLLDSIGVKLAKPVRKLVDGVRERVYCVDNPAMLDPVRVEVLQAIARKFDGYLQSESVTKVNWEESPPLNPVMEIAATAEITAEITTVAETEITATTQAMATPRAGISVELPVENQQPTEAVIEKLLKISNWGEVAVNQAEIDEVWPLLSQNQRSHLWELHQTYQQQLSLEELAQQAIATQAEIKETGFGSHFRSYVLKAVRGGIAIARKCWGDKQECSIPLNQLLLAN